MALQSLDYVHRDKHSHLITEELSQYVGVDSMPISGLVLLQEPSFTLGVLPNHVNSITFRGKSLERVTDFPYLRILHLAVFKYWFLILSHSSTASLTSPLMKAVLEFPPTGRFP